MLQSGVCNSSEVSNVLVEKCNRMAVIIKQDFESHGNMRNAVEKHDNIDDQFFELTVNDVQSIRRDLRAEAFVPSALNKMIHSGNLFNVDGVVSIAENAILDYMLLIAYKLLLKH